LALNNEAYIVQTTTAGEIIVPLKEAVPYINITLIGYQHYSYHSLMSQNMANIADDIKALQDGGQSQAIFDLDQLLADTNANIDSQILNIESGINDKIIFLTDQAVAATNTQLSNFNIILNGDDETITGVVGEMTELKAALGDDNSGMIKQIKTLEDAVGDTESGLVQQVNAYSDIVTSVQLTSIDLDTRITDNEFLLTSANGLVPKVTTLETVVGTTGSGLVGQSQLNNDMIFGDGNYRGLINIVGTTTEGLIYQVNTIGTALSTQTDSVNIKVNELELAVGHLDTSGLTLKTDNLKNDQDLIEIDVTDISSRLLLVENMNIQEVRDTIYEATTGLVQKVQDNYDDIILLSTSTGDNSTITNDSIIAVDAKVDNNISNISTNATNITTNATNIDNIELELYAVDIGIKPRVDNMKQYIINELFTYDNGSGDEIITSLIFNTMMSRSNEIHASNVLTQFETYFGVTGSFLVKDEIGLERLNIWITDATAEGFEQKSKTYAQQYIDANYNLTDLTNDLELLNESESVPGSIDYRIRTEVDILDDQLNGVDGLITIINSDDTIPGSVDYKIAEQNTTTIEPLEIEVSNIQTTIVENQTNFKNQTEELQVEMARYDTILPFLQTMFKYVNNGDNITNDEIDTVFATVLDKVTTLASTISNIDYKFEFNQVSDTDASLNNLEITVILDKSLSFASINPVAGDTAWCEIIRLDDNAWAYGGLEVETGDTPIETDSAGNLVVDSGILVLSVESYIYDELDEEQATPIDVLTLDAPNDTLVLRFGTLDIFGQT